MCTRRLETTCGPGVLWNRVRARRSVCRVTYSPPAPSDIEGNRGMSATMVSQQHGFATRMPRLDKISQDQPLSVTSPSGLASIVVPCCGQLEYTKLCMPSLLKHTRQPFEL